MQKKTIFNLGIVLAGLIAYGYIRADDWRLLLVSGEVRGRIEKVNEFNSDPHTTAFRVSVNYSFVADGNVYHGKGNRVLRKGENTADISWLPGTGIDIVYVRADPGVNNVSGREYAVVFPLVLVPVVFAIDMLISRRSRKDS